MANSSSISIDSETAYSVMTYVANSSTILDSDVSSKLSSGFEALTSLGFLTSLSTIQGQVTTLINAHNKIVSEISSHMSVASEQEEDLKSGYESGTFGGGGGSSGGGGGGGYSGYSYGGEQEGETETQITEEEDGTQVSSDQLREMILNMDDAYKSSLIELINTNKESDISFNALLLDYSNCMALYTVIKEIFGDKINIDNMTLEDYIKTQKTIVDMIVKSDVDVPELSENSILIGKEYLAKVASSEEIEPSDLIFDEKYEKTLKTALTNMYNGEVRDDMTETAVENFKAYMDSLAAKYECRVEDLINNHLDLVKKGI